MSVTPGKLDLAIYRGDTYAWRIELQADSLPWDLTGATAKSEIREKSAGVLVTDMACVITLPNLIDVALEVDDWSTIPAKGIWDLQVTTADGGVYTVLAGAVTATPDVTDSVVAPAGRR